MDKRSPETVVRTHKARRHILAQQCNVGRVRAVARRYSPAGVVAVGGIAKCRGAAESQIGEVKYIVTVEACQGASEIHGMVDFQGGLRTRFDRNVLVKRSTYSKSGDAVHQHRARATHLAGCRDI